MVASLWSVDDRATGQFMESFYRELNGGLRPSAALRQAKLAFLASDNPARHQLYRWAPFVIVGEPPRR